MFSLTSFWKHRELKKVGNPLTVRPRVYSCLSTSAAPLLAVVRFKTQQQQQATKTVFFSHFLFVFVYCCAIVISRPSFKKSEKKTCENTAVIITYKIIPPANCVRLFVAVVSLLWMWWVCNMVFFKVVLKYFWQPEGQEFKSFKCCLFGEYYQA